MTAGAHDDDDGGAERPSKSARKRAAHAAQDLGVALLRLPEAELVALALPEALLEAIRAARRINSRAAGARQRQYIGKLMRELDLKRLPQANLFERADDYSSCAYFYLDRPEGRAEPLPPVAERQRGL